MDIWELGVGFVEVIMGYIKKFVGGLPEHEAELIITHNTHKGRYMSVSEYIEFMEIEGEFIDDFDMMKCIESNDMWTVQWYTHTPIGSTTIHGSSLELIMEAIK